MNTIDWTPLYRSTIGYDRLAGLLDSAFRSDTSASGYPPYDIEVVDDNHYAITLAVAGFTDSELDINVERGILTVRGEKSTSGEKHKYLYQGIASRTFERKFNLADYVEVSDAKLDNGLLTISLVREVPEAMKPKRIEINSDQPVIDHKPSKSESAKVA